MSGEAKRRERAARAALERWLQRDRTCCVLTRGIRRGQTTLRSSMSKDAWRQYLEIEELHNQRQARIIDKLVAMAARVKRAPR